MGSDGAMDTVRVSLGYKVEFLTPYHIGTGYGLAGVIDSRTARGKDRFAYVPGSSLKGRLKPHFRQVLSLLQSQAAHGWKDCLKPCGGNGCSPPCLACVIFGNARTRGSMHFGDARISEDTRLELERLFRETPGFYFPAEIADSEVRTSVMISRRFGTAEPKHLFNFELGRPGFVLRGWITGRLDKGSCVKVNGEDVPMGVPVLATAMRDLDDLGGGNSRGWGACKVSVERVLLEGKELGVDGERPGITLEALLLESMRGVAA